MPVQTESTITAQDRTLQERTIYGKEKSLADVQEKDRFHIVVANPPFGGKERKEVQQNFPIRKLL